MQFFLQEAKRRRVDNIKIERGFLDCQRRAIGEMYWDAFSGKLGKVLTGGDSAVSFIAEQLHPAFAIVACDEGGRVAGVAGFKTDKGELVNFSFAALAAAYGWFGAVWRMLLLLPLERAVEGDCLLMDGIFVCKNRRGRGIGARLLAEVEREAARQGKKYIRLDVIDKNAAAKGLYEKVGFKVVKTHSAGFLSGVFGFAKCYEMRKAAAGKGA